MKGMLIKDFRLLKNQGKTLFLMLLVVAVFMNLLTVVGPSFIVGYITIMFSMFTVSTISYDEFDNCYLFLLTLPVSRKKYVNEKYLYALLSIIFAWCVGLALGMILVVIPSSAGIGAAEWIETCLGYIFTAWIFVGILIPLRLKFESEKARYANLIVILGVIIAAFLAASAIEYVPEEIVGTGKQWFSGLGSRGLMVLFVGITIAVVIISYLCSQRIMAKKEL